MINKAKACPKRVVFPEGDEDKIIRAAQILIDEGIAKPILLGDKEEIEATRQANSMLKLPAQRLSIRKIHPNARNILTRSLPCVSARVSRWQKPTA